MKEIYKFFGLEKQLSISSMLSQWDNRTEISSSVNGSVSTYDRYDEKYGLHKKIKKDVDNE